MDTGERRLLRRMKGRQAFIGPGQVSGNYAVWSVRRRRCDVIRYDIAARIDTQIENPGSYQRAPSVTPGGTVYFSRGGNRCGVSVLIQGSVTIIKDSVPDDPQDFEFVHNLGGPLTFLLDDDPGSSLQNLKIIPSSGPGTYEVRELSPGTGWDLTGIDCLDPDGNSSGNVATGIATIRLGPGEAVQCTFTNSEA
jgi:hypothetical protein